MSHGYRIFLKVALIFKWIELKVPDWSQIKPNLQLY